MKFFTSDLHIDHKNIIRYSNRPFKDVDEMKESMISRWNAKVNKGDQVYILGDVFFCSADEAMSVIKRLNGQKFLVYGNHDKVIRNNKQLQDCFVKCAEYMELTEKIGSEKQHMVMCHYPMITWNRAHHGSWMLHGHCHGNLKYPFEAKILDVGVDVHNYEPISLIEVERIMRNKKFSTVDHHGD